MVINMIIYGTIFFLAYNWITGLTGEVEVLSGRNNLIIDSLRFLVKIAAFLIVLVFCYLCFVIFGGLVSAPFDEFISKYVEQKLFKVFTSADLPFFKEITISVREESKKLLFYFSVIIPLFIVNFIPMIGSTISIALGTPFSCYFNALDFMDYPLTRLGVPFRQKLRIINTKLPLSMGFGSIAFILTFLPVINALLKPLLVVSGTCLFYEKQYDSLLNNQTYTNNK
jgi:CysZ protein